MAALVRQDTDVDLQGETVSANVDVLLRLKWPYHPTSTNWASTSVDGITAVSVTQMSSCPDYGAHASNRDPCVATYRVSITPSAVCSLDGPYSLFARIDCSPDFHAANSTGCPLLRTTSDVVQLDFELDSENFCAQVIDEVDSFAALAAYGDASFSGSKRASFLLEQTVFFELVVQGDVLPLSSTLETLDLEYANGTQLALVQNGVPAAFLPTFEFLSSPHGHVVRFSFNLTNPPFDVDDSRYQAFDILAVVQLNFGGGAGNVMLLASSRSIPAFETILVSGLRQFDPTVVPSLLGKFPGSGVVMDATLIGMVGAGALVLAALAAGGVYRCSLCFRQAAAASSKKKLPADVETAVYKRSSAPTSSSRDGGGGGGSSRQQRSHRDRESRHRTRDEHLSTDRSNSPHSHYSTHSAASSRSHHSTRSRAHSHHSATPGRSPSHSPARSSAGTQPRSRSRRGSRDGRGVSHSPVRGGEPADAALGSQSRSVSHVSRSGASFQPLAQVRPGSASGGLPPLRSGPYERTYGFEAPYADSSVFDTQSIVVALVWLELQGLPEFREFPRPLADHSQLPENLPELIERVKPRLMEAAM